jgi:thiol-disulfide isomerase/thioredoxin
MHSRAKRNALVTPVKAESLEKRCLLSVNPTTPIAGLSGPAAPAITTQYTDGTTFTLPSVNQPILIMDFWASWCEWCMLGLPDINSFNSWAQQNDEPVKVVTVNEGDSVPTIESTWAGLGFTLPAVLDGEFGTIFSDYAAPFGADGIPFTVVVAGDKITWEQLGYTDTTETSLQTEVNSITQIMTDTWTGSVSNDWNNSGNWSTGAVPGNASDVVINSGTVVASSPFSVVNLTVSGGTLRLPSGLGTCTASNLTISGTGTLDLGNNELLINYGSNADPISTVAAYLKSGYNGGNWTGSGIDSSAAALSKGAYGIGFADGADGAVPGLGSGQIELKYTLNGDANLDGLVNGADSTILAANFNQSITGWDHGDFNYDGLVNAADSNELAANFNQSVNLSPPGLVAGSGAMYTITGSTGAQTLDVLSGAVTLTSDLSGLLANYSLQIQKGASVVLASDQHIGALQLVGNGSLDLRNHSMFINYGSNSDPISAIAGYIKSGYNGGGWNGPGIISVAAQTPTNGLYYGLGYADGKDKVVSGLISGQIEIKYTLLGDANLDGLVNGSDFNILAANLNQSISGWDQGDFNYDGLVNAADFNDLSANFNQGVSGASVASSAAVVAAPAAPAPKSKPFSVSKAVSGDTTNKKPKVSAVTAYAAGVVPSAGSTATSQSINKDAKFLADR